MLFVDNDQKNKYYRAWKEILKIINGGHGELKSCKEIRLFYDNLPIGHVFKIHSMTIVIKSLIEKDNKFYPEISLNHCSYEIKHSLVQRTYKNMLEYDRIDLSEGIDVNKTSNSRECSFCHYYYFLDKILIIKSICVMVVTICL